MRAPIYFYVTRYHRETRPFAVPVHLVDVPNFVRPAVGGGWVNVRALAGRRAGETFTIVRSDLSRGPGNARLAPGSREAIARYGRPEPDEVLAARRLRKRIGTRSLTERQLERAIEEARQLAARVRAKTPHDRAWIYFDKDLNDWDARGDERGDGGARAIGMIDMILGAASRYEPPPVDVGSPAYRRAERLDADAKSLFARTLGLGFVNPKPWFEVTDAFEVAEDAWREAGDDDRADGLMERRNDILDVLRNNYGPRRP